MIIVRDRHTRGKMTTGLVDARYTFSFGDYRDPDHMGFSDLRVINEDHVAPGTGFPEHGHADMEIITYVIEGAVQHRDSLGNEALVVPGDVQRMSAGTGIRHSEMNPSQTNPLHALQIWIFPEAYGIAPTYEQKHFHREDLQGKLRLIADRWGSDGALTIHQDVAIYAAEIAESDRIAYAIKPGRRLWLQVVRGIVRINGDELREGDGARIYDEQGIELDTDHRGEFLLFDLR
jgi:redox-sensitive bicupin YhaK (pirin superfamily)